MAPHHSIPNMVVKRYCGKNTKRAVSWEDNTMPKFQKYQKILARDSSKAVSSVVECLPYKQMVTGSTPVPPINYGLIV